MSKSVPNSIDHEQEELRGARTPWAWTKPSPYRCPRCGTITLTVELAVRCPVCLFTEGV